LILDNNDNDEPFINHGPNNENTSDLDEQHLSLPQPMPRRSSCITIPTEKNPNGGPAITKTAAAVQESQESAA